MNLTMENLVRANDSYEAENECNYRSDQPDGEVEQHIQ